MKDLVDLLKDQIEFLPINRNRYYYNEEESVFYVVKNDRKRRINGILSTGNISLLKSDGNPKVVSINRLKCFFKNGLNENMKSILDPGWVTNKDEFGNLKWVSISEKKMEFNRERLNKVFEDHPDLYLKEGFYDEGVIPYKHREGFFIVPLTNGTFAINPITQEAVYTYSNELLCPQFHSRGDRKYTLNERLAGGKGTVMSSRAIMFVSKPIPDRYKKLGKSFAEIVSKLEVDHIDGNPSNNAISNLQYLTSQENLVKKLNQEQDPRVFPTTWISPEGKEVRFRSFRQVAEAIGCNLAAVFKTCKGWRKNNLLNGWKLIEGKHKHPLESVYIKFEERGIDRTSLTMFKKEYMVYKLEDKSFHLFSTIDDLCSNFNIKVSGLETHIAMKGPLVPYKDFVIFPQRYLGVILDIKYLEQLIG